MKIVSWNVNGIRAAYNKGLKSFVKKASPDILCLQETKAHPDQIETDLAPFEYWSVCGVKKGYSGTCIFSKKKALNIGHGIGIKKFDWEGRVISFETKDFILLNIYFPNGAMTLARHEFKQEFLKRLPPFLKNLREKTKKELIILGDYNVAYEDIDVHAPKTLGNTSGFLPEERTWMRDFLKEGYTDVFRHFYPKKKDIYTWWSLREGARAKNKGWRIDHILVTKKLLSKIKSIKILDKQMGSDHCPVVLEL